MHLYRAYTSSRPEHKKGAHGSLAVSLERRRVGSQKDKLILVLLLLRRDVMVVVRRLRSANSVRNATKTREGSDYTCKRSSQFAARAPIRQRRAARLSKSPLSREDIVWAHFGHLSSHILPKIRLKPIQISSQISSRAKYPPTVRQ